MEKTPTLRAHVVIDISICKSPMGCVALTIRPHRRRIFVIAVEVAIAAASHGVQAFIGQFPESGILVQILFVFHDDFPFFVLFFLLLVYMRQTADVIIICFLYSRCSFDCNTVQQVTFHYPTLTIPYSNDLIGENLSYLWRSSVVEFNIITWSGDSSCG